MRSRFFLFLVVWFQKEIRGLCHGAIMVIVVGSTVAGCLMMLPMLP